MPLFVVNLFIHLRKAIAVMSKMISRWIAQETQQVNKQIQILWDDSLIRTNISPAKSTLVVNKKKNNLKSVGMTLAKVKKQDGMTLAKVKEQDGIPSCSEVPSILISAACHKARCVHLHHLETERLYNIPWAEPSKVKTSSGKALKTYN